MLALLALFFLLLFPAFAAVLIRIASVRFGLRDVWSSIGAGALTLAGAVLWRITGSEAVIGGWTTVSFDGAPLLIGAAPAASMAVIALAAIRLCRIIEGDAQSMDRGITAALAFAAAALACLAQSIPALLIGIGLADLCGAWLTARERNGVAAIRLFGPQCAALLLAGMAYVLRVAGSSDPLLLNSVSASGETGLVRTLLSLAVLLHGNVIPAGGYRRTQGLAHAAQIEAGILGAAALAQHSPGVDIWSLALAIVSSLFWLIHALDARIDQQQTDALRGGTAMLALAAGAITGPLAALSVWLVLSQLIHGPAPLRMLAALGFAGIPIFAGFGITSSAVAELTGRSVLGLGLALLLTATQAICVGAALRLCIGNSRLSVILRSSAGEWRALTHFGLWLIALLALALGLAPAIAGRPGLIALPAQMGIAGWVHLLLTVPFGLLLWQLASNPAVQDGIERVIGLIEGGQSIGQLGLGAIGRIQSGLRLVFVFLESDGALLWAGMVVLMAILVAGNSTP